jgi:hypothetical protein
LEQVQQQVQRKSDSIIAIEVNSDRTFLGQFPNKPYLKPVAGSYAIPEVAHAVQAVNNDYVTNMNPPRPSVNQIPKEYTAASYGPTVDPKDIEGTIRLLTSNRRTADNTLHIPTGRYTATAPGAQEQFRDAFSH